MKVREEDAKIRKAIKEFPKEFKLRAFPDKKFFISENASYMSGDTMYLYVFLITGIAFCKGTPEELRGQIV